MISENRTKQTGDAIDHDATLAYCMIHIIIDMKYNISQKCCLLSLSANRAFQKFWIAARFVDFRSWIIQVYVLQEVVYFMRSWTLTWTLRKRDTVDIHDWYGERKRVTISDPKLLRYQQYIINTLSYYKSIMKMKNCHNSNNSKNSDDKKQSSSRLN